MADAIELPRMLHHPDGGRLIVQTLEELRVAEADGWQRHRVLGDVAADVAPPKKRRKGAA